MYFLALILHGYSSFHHCLLPRAKPVEKRLPPSARPSQHHLIGARPTSGTRRFSPSPPPPYLPSPPPSTAIMSRAPRKPHTRRNPGGACCAHPLAVTLRRSLPFYYNRHELVSFHLDTIGSLHTATLDNVPKSAKDRSAHTLPLIGNVAQPSTLQDVRFDDVNYARKIGRS